MTGTPHFRFTFFNTALYPAGVVVPAPLGWKDASISLERHKEYHSLIEYFKGSFLWYGLARQVIREVEDDQGPEAELRCLIEVTYGAGFETVFDGLIDISQQEDIAKAGSFYKQQAPIIRDDFWAKFINRKSTPVDLEATVDLDGNARTPVNKIVLPLPSQVMRNRSVWLGANGLSGSDVGVVNSERTAQIGLSRDIGEIKDTYQIEFAERPNNLDGLINVIEVREQGDIVFDVTGTARIQANSTQNFDFSSAQISFFRVGQTETIFQTASESSNSIDRTFDLSGQKTLNAEIGDLIYIYVVWNVSHEDVGPTTGNINFQFDIDLNIEAVQNSTMPDTSTDAYLIKDAAESILSKIVGRDSVVKSDVLTNTCKRLRAIMRGKHVRGYNMSGNSNPDLNKEFFMKFDEWFEGASPLLFLGLGYTEVGGNPKIEIEPISDFYDPDFTVTFDNVSDLVRTYDQDKIFKAIEIGFQKWSSESESGIDDPQTKRNYRTKFATIGQELKILCKWLAASLAIERSRRNRVELGKDDRNDEEIISICLTEYEGGYTPEFSENFDSVTGLLNSDFRYNIRDSVARIVKRWQSFLQGCLQHTTGEKLYFASGEGNYSMRSLLSSGDCEVSPEDVGSGLSEDQDIDVTTDFIFIPKLYKCKVPMSWAKYKTIVATRKKAIGISRTTENHVAAFIMELDYKLVGGYAEMLVLLGENTDV